MMVDERAGTLAKMRTGIDVEKERRRRTLTIAVLSALAGVGIAAWSNRADASPETSSAGGGDLTSVRLSMEGFTQGQIQRILKVQPLVDQWSKTRGLDPDLVNGVIWAESRFQTRALSPVGARGLMQVMPATQKGWEVETARTGDIWSPEHNIFLGTYGLKKLLDRWGGNIPRALASYNWGIGNVMGSPDSYPAVTDQYIEDVMAARDRFSRARSRP